MICHFTVKRKKGRGKRDEGRGTREEGRGKSPQKLPETPVTFMFGYYLFRTSGRRKTWRDVDIWCEVMSKLGNLKESF